MPVGDVTMQVPEPHRQVDTPAPLPDVQVKGHVVALVSGLAGRASLPPLVAVAEPDEPWQRYHPSQQLQHVRGRALLASQQADVQVAPAHQPREVATDHQHRPDVGEQLVEVQLREDVGGFGLQRRLPGEQPLVTGRGRHPTIPTTHCLHMTRSARRRAAGERRRTGLVSERQVLTARLHKTYIGTLLAATNTPMALRVSRGAAASAACRTSDPARTARAVGSAGRWSRRR